MKTLTLFLLAYALSITASHALLIVYPGTLKKSKTKELKDGTLVTKTTCKGIKGVCYTEVVKANTGNPDPVIELTWYSGNVPVKSATFQLLDKSSQDGSGGYTTTYHVKPLP